jgi:enterochelin esterase family protein
MTANRLVRYHPVMRIFPALLLLATFPALAQNDRPATPAPEPIVNPDHTVTFRLKFPSAQKVMLALENHPPAAMTQDAAGLWTITTEALDPEYYSYHFTVDGTTVLDPLNPKVIESYTSAGNAVLVPYAPEGNTAVTTCSGLAPNLACSGPGPWEHTAVPHGQSIYYVYTPPNYDPRSSIKYPVLYLLHGWSDTAGGWTNIGHADNILDNLIAQGKAKPMIVVMPLGYGDMSFLRNGFGVWRDPAAIDHNLALFSQTLLTEDHAIAGLSMGGLEALSIGIANPQKFAWVGGFSAAVHEVKPESLASFNAKTASLKLVYISVGLKDDLLAPDRAYAAALRAAGQPVTTMEREHLGHVWQEWRPDLAQFASTIFK